MKRKPFTFSDVALGNLRYRKRQYILLAVGIVLAICFAAASLLFGYGLYTSLMARMWNQYGEHDAILYHCGGVPVEELVADGTFSRIGKAEILAFAMVGDSEQGSFSMAKYDEEAMAITHRRLKEGEFPKKAGEIALDQGALARLRTGAGIGDTVTLTLRIPDGEDFLPETIEMTYALTGILYDQSVTVSYERLGDYSAGMFSPAEQIEPGGRADITVYGVLSAKSNDAYARLDAFTKENGINWSREAGRFDNNIDIETIFMGGSVIILGIVLVLACCLGIVNAFSANLDARRRQIGLLRAVGATRRQIKRVFGRETLILALTSAPLGIGLAVASVYGAFALLGGDFHFVPNAWVLLGVAAAGVASITIASSIPLRRAAAVSPMQAVRDVDLIRAVTKRAVKSKKQFDVARLVASRGNMIYKTRKMGISIMLAAGILLFTATFLLLSQIVDDVLRDYSHSVDYRIGGPYPSWGDVLTYGLHAPGLSEGDKLDISALPLVKQVEGLKEMRIKMLPEDITSYATGDGWMPGLSYLSPDIPPYETDIEMAGQWQRREYDEYQEGKARYGYTGDYLNAKCLGMEESIIHQLNPFVYEGRINIEKLRSGEEVLLIAPEHYQLYYTPLDNGYCLGFENREEPLTRIVSEHSNDMYRVGDTIALSMLYSDGQERYDEEGHMVWPEDAIRIDTTAKVGALLNVSVDGKDLNSMGFDTYVEFMDVITTIPGLAALGYDIPYQTLSVQLTEKPDSQTEAYLQQTLEQITSRTPGADLASYLEMNRSNRRFALQFISVTLALVILMMAITGSMMNNTLSAHIRAGRRGIGTLRAVGVSDRVIFRSYLYQLLYLFAWGGGVGYIVSIVFTCILQKYPLLGIQNAPISFWQPIAFIAFLFGICLLNVRARLKGVLRESVIENIRVL